MGEGGGAVGSRGRGPAHRNGTVAGRLLADCVLGRANPWASVFDPFRRRAVVGGGIISRDVHVARHWISGMLGRGERRSASALGHGDGAVLDTDAGKAAVYRDPDGAYHFFSPYCPHMGCELSWNNLELTWDCSCHGSRFEAEGAVLHGPARRPMKLKSVR